MVLRLRECVQLTDLSVPVLLVLPAGRQLPVLAGEHVDERHEVAVVLVPLEGRGVAPDARHHVLHGRPVEQERLKRSVGLHLLLKSKWQP